MRTVRYLQLVALLGCALILPRKTYAEGEGLMPGGAAAISRGGAIAAKPVDALTLMHNPAGLTALDGHQGHYGLDMQLDSICVEPYGYYGFGELFVFVFWSYSRKNVSRASPSSFSVGPLAFSFSI